MKLSEKPIYVDRTTSECESLPSTVDGTFQSCDGPSFNNNMNGNVTCGGWQNMLGNADTYKLPIGVELQSYFNINIPNSNNGGIFTAALAMIVGSNPNTKESFKTDLTNLIPGEIYKVTFEQINLCKTSFVGTSVRWKVIFGNQTNYSPAMDTTPNPQWMTTGIECIRNGRILGGNSRRSCASVRRCCGLRLRTGAASPPPSRS